MRHASGRPGKNAAPARSPRRILCRSSIPCTDEKRLKIITLVKILAWRKKSPHGRGAGLGKGAVQTFDHPLSRSPAEANNENAPNSHVALASPPLVKRGANNPRGGGRAGPEGQPLNPVPCASAPNCLGPAKFMILISFSCTEHLHFAPPYRPKPRKDPKGGLPRQRQSGSGRRRRCSLPSRSGTQPGAVSARQRRNGAT